MKIEQKDIVEMSFLEGQISMIEMIEKYPFCENIYPNTKGKTILDLLEGFKNLRKEKLEEIIKRNTN